MSARDAGSAVLLEEGLPTSGSDSEGVPGRVVVRGAGRKTLLKLGGGVLALVALGGVVGVALHPRDRIQKADPDQKVEEFGFAALAAAAAGFTQAAKLVSDGQSIGTQFSKLGQDAANPIQGYINQVNNDSAAGIGKVNLTQMDALEKKDLLSQKGDDKHDGNICNNDEELHAGLCYESCSKLTAGTHPIRTTAWSCCAQEPCSFFNSVFSNPLNLCEGYDVAGPNEGKGCPHQVGDCMVNEEFMLGMCYKKCAILTRNNFTFRSGPETCCRYSNHFACLDALNAKTDPCFDVGGGFHDNQSDTPNFTHAPMLGLTESIKSPEQVAALASEGIVIVPPSAMNSPGLPAIPATLAPATLAPLPPLVTMAPLPTPVPLPMLVPLRTLVPLPTPVPWPTVPPFGVL